MRRKDRAQVIVITLYAWERVCQARDFRGLQIALYLSIAMATRLKVDMLTEIPVGDSNRLTFQRGSTFAWISGCSDV